MGRPLLHLARSLALAVALLAARQARADGIGATAEVGYSSGTNTITDAAGRSSTIESMFVPQRYRLNVDKQFYPYLILNASGLYQWIPGWSALDGLWNTTESHRWNVFASLVVGPPILNATPYYVRRQEYALVGANGVTTRSPTLVNQGYGVFAGWNPAGLPLLSLQVGRNENFDLGKTLQNNVADTVVASLSYLEVKDLSLLYSLRYSHTNDVIAGVVGDDLVQSTQVAWSGRFWNNRLTTTLNYAGSYRTGRVESSGSGNVSIQQFPVGGLSLVERFPSTPGIDTLLPNPALIDGDVLASAGIDIGYGPSLAGDQNLRDLGVLFSNPTTEVNVLRLWVDRQLTPAIAAAYAFTAWQSDDNLTWTQLPITGPVTFGAFENRFDIPIPRTQARYLKVVTRPLSTSVTVDPQYAAVLVTELQPWLVVPANEVPTSSQQWGGTFGASARALLWQDWNLTYTFAFRTSHQDSFALQEWSVLNSIGAGRTVAPGVNVNAQLARTDSAQQGVPHEAINRWSAQLGYDPFTTLGGSLTYSGQYGQLYVGEAVTHSVTLTGHADPWQGVSLLATGSYSWARDQLGRTLQSPSGSVGFTLTPLQVLAINGTWGVSSAIALTPTGLVQTQRTSSLQGSLSFTPVRALYFSAGILRSMGSDVSPQTLLNFGAGFSPFAGGQLLIRFGYDENLDTLSRVRNRIFGPSLRWNIRTGTYLDVAYTWNDSIQPALLTQARTLFANFFLSL